MLSYVIYLGVAVLCLWSVWFLVCHVRRQLKGDCGACGGDCGQCGKDCHGPKP